MIVVLLVSPGTFPSGAIAKWMQGDELKMENIRTKKPNQSNSMNDLFERKAKTTSNCNRTKGFLEKLQVK